MSHTKSASYLTEFLFARLRNEPKTLALCLSSSPGSQRLLDVLVALGKHVCVYSYTVENAPSRDFDWARRKAREKNVAFAPIYLPRNTSILKTDLAYIVKEKNVTVPHVLMKVWPMYYLLHVVQEDVVVTGLHRRGMTTQIIEGVAAEQKLTIRNPYLHSKHIRPKQSVDPVDPQISRLFDQLLAENPQYRSMSELCEQISREMA